MNNKLLYIILWCCYSLFAQAPNDTQPIDIQRITAKIELDTIKKAVKGNIKVQFKAIKNTDSAYLDAQKFTSVNSDTSDITYQNNKIWLQGNFKANQQYTYEFDYETTPKKTLYFWGWNPKNKDTTTVNRQQIWSQGQGKYTSYWLPSIDNMNDKIVFDLTFNFHSDYQVISNGNLVSKKATSPNINQWHYQMQQPMSSYLVALTIGKYQKTVVKSNSAIGLENYIYPEEIDHYESTYRHHQEIFDFLEKEIGVPYPWEVYRQVPVRDFLYAGMENTACTLFDDEFIVDVNAFADKNFVNVSAHELAHQWFGNLITETDSRHHWLHEGFATYYALKVEQQIFGNDYFYFKLYESAEQLTALNDTESATPLIITNGSSLNYYQRGAWAIFALENYLGETLFKKSIQQFLKKYAYKNVTTDDFLETVLETIQETSNKELSSFAETWLLQKNFPTKQALDLLTQSEFMQKYLQLAGERTQPLIGKYQLLSDALNFPVNPYLGQEVVSQLYGDTSPEAQKLLQKAFDTNHPKIEFALANTLSSIPIPVKKNMEKLLHSKSYATVESALYQLWNNFDSDKKKYLDKTKNIIGFSNKNVRTLWLLLALNTPGYSIEERASFFSELQKYTAPNHRIGTRINAFRYLGILQSYNDQSIINLSNGATHPNWQFNKFCTKTIEKMLQQPKFQNKFRRLYVQLPIKVQKMVDN